MTVHHRIGIDTPKGLDQYTIEWDPCETCSTASCFHRRAIWDPTSLNHPPITLHVNTWPTASHELAGRWLSERCPIARGVAVDIYDIYGPDSPGSL